MQSNINNKSTLVVGVLSLIFISYFSYKLAFTENYRIFILDDFNLLIHEAGHLAFTAFGQTVSLLGGTILQLFIPVVFLTYFAIKKDFFGSIFSTFWLGENLINVSIYIKDAKQQILPLVGGGIHDWYTLLSSWNLLDKFQIIGNIFFVVGCVTLFVALFINLFQIFRSTPTVS